MELIGLVTTKMTSDGLCNLVVLDKEKNQYNLKMTLESSKGIIINHIYKFDCMKKEGQRVGFVVKEYKDIKEVNEENIDEIYRSFLASSPISFDDGKNEVLAYVEKIENKVIKDITVNLLNKYEDKFFIYPAAAKMHHAYVGGLVHHCLSMLHLADAFIANFSYLNKDYLYAGIILHDIGKATELDGVVDTAYSLEGQLIGHLVIGAIDIANAAKELGYEDKEEVLLLKHMLISHHGLPQFGSAKKPMTPEALALWYIDTIDSKFRVLGTELEKVEKGSFTDNIGVIDKMKIYKS